MIVCKKCGAVDNYIIERKANNNVATCRNCGAFIKNIAYEQPKFYIGKYKDTPIKEIEELSYLKWALSTLKLSENIKSAVQQRISQLEFISK